MSWRKIIFAWLFSGCISRSVHCQEIPAGNEQQLENLADTEQSQTEDDTWLQDMEHFRKHPLPVNKAAEEEFRQLRVLNDLQIASLLSYRRLFGKLVSIYELQAVPHWDLVTIRKLIPFITLEEPFSLKEGIGPRFQKGEHSLLFRLSQTLAGKKPVRDPGYTGSPLRLLLRYRYAYKNLLQAGILGDKDAGEPFLKAPARAGFDFYSAHLFLRKLGAVQAVAIGDFTVNMGQGLIHWQSLAFRKSAEVTAVKRQSAVLRPYSSSGEFYFHRGAGVTVKKGKLETTLFISFRQLSANAVFDSVMQYRYITSLLTSGLHRSPAELADRNQVSQTGAGATIRYTGKRGQVAVNAVAFRFSLPIQKRNEPYNLYAINGRHWRNLSVDYSHTYRNLHFFGEAAVDREFNRAFINGLLMSVEPRVELTLLHRHIAAGYQSVYGNAFTESTSPVGENGIYTGISIRPGTGWRISAYSDLYRFPWLRYRVDAPGRGSDWLLWIQYSPGKQAEIYLRFRNESKQGNMREETGSMNYLAFQTRENWRINLVFRLNSAIQLRSRLEMTKISGKGPFEENGYLIYNDILYKPMGRPFSAGIRLQYFESESYDSRIYAYENDVLYSYSIPAFSGKGTRVYLNFNIELFPGLDIWLRVAQTAYRKSSSGPENGEGATRSGPELKIQTRWVF